MINLLSFVVILFGSKSKPLHDSIEVLPVRKTHGRHIVYYSPHRRKFRNKRFLTLNRKKGLSCAPILLPIQSMMDNKTTGTVKFFNADKGFGFIKHDDGNKETFVHASGLIDQIKENDRVEFDLQNGKKGLNAVNVKKI